MITAQDLRSSSNKVTVIYHDNCVDGFTSAYIARVGLSDMFKTGDFIGAKYGEPIPDVSAYRDRDVLILDFSYGREALLEIKKQASSVLVLDHHKTAEENLRGLDFCYFDQTKSGARLTFDFFFEAKPVPNLVAYVEDRDLWKFELNRSKDVNAYIGMYAHEYELWDLLFYELGSWEGGVDPEVFVKGAVVRQHIEFLVSKIASQAKQVKIGGYTVYAANSTVFQSEIGSKLAVSNPFGVVWGYQASTNDFVFSLRSTSEGVDVREIAEQYGGGGHRNAAGFSVKEAQLKVILRGENGADG